MRKRYQDLDAETKDFKSKSEVLMQAEKAKFAKSQMDLGERDLQLQKCKADIDKL